jgi:hypothetical protein
VVSAERKVIIGNPKTFKISTSYVERQNLTMRMQMRRFTRLTNAFSKKLDNLKAAVALHFVHYNFVRVLSAPICAIFPPARRIGFEKRIVWEILLGQRGSKTSLGQK